MRFFLFIFLVYFSTGCSISVVDNKNRNNGTSSLDKRRESISNESGECVRELERDKTGYTSLPLLAQGITEGTAIETANLSRVCSEGFDVNQKGKPSVCKDFYREQNIKRKRICLPPYPPAQPLVLEAKKSHHKPNQVKLTTTGGGGYGEIRITKESGDCIIEGKKVIFKNSGTCTVGATQSADEFYSESKSELITIDANRLE